MVKISSLFSRKEIFLVVIITIFFTLISYSVKAISINLEKDIYYPGDTILVDVSLKNESKDEVRWDIGCSLVCREDYFYPVFLSQRVELKPDEEKTIGFPFSVKENMPSGKYDVRVAIMENSKELETALKELEIRDTKKVIEAYLMTCEDRDCKIPKKIFLLGEKAYIKIYSDISELNIEGEIKTPTGSENLFFTDYVSEYSLSFSGNYKIYVSLSKDGYFPVVKTIDFGVIEEGIKIKKASVCKVDGVCSNDEDYQNCPQDCSNPFLKTRKSFFQKHWHILLAIAILVIFICLFSFIRKKRIKKEFA